MFKLIDFVFVSFNFLFLFVFGNVDFVESSLKLVATSPRKRRWSGGAMVLGKFSLPGRPTNMDFNVGRGRSNVGRGRSNVVITCV